MMMPTSGLVGVSGMVRSSDGFSMIIAVFSPLPLARGERRARLNAVPRM